MNDDLTVLIALAILDRASKLGSPLDPRVAEEFAVAAREAVRLWLTTPVVEAV
jgi:hypothetical protein